METLQNVLEVLAAEMRRANVALEAMPKSFAANQSATFLEKIETENSAEMRERINSACLYYGQHLKWPAGLSEVELWFAYYRVVEAVQFGHWLYSKRVTPEVKAAESWCQWLLYDYWEFAGRARWKEKIRRLLENPES